MFKYELDEIIYYMGDNVICSAPVLSRAVIENLHDDWDATTEQAQSFMPFGKAGIKYNTCHGIFEESEVSSDPQEIADRLVARVMKRQKDEEMRRRKAEEPGRLMQQAADEGYAEYEKNKNAK